MIGSLVEMLRPFGEVREHEPMSRHTTLGVGGPARVYFRPHDRARLVQAVRALDASLPCLPLGRGSNLLVLDEGFDGVVIDLAPLNHVVCKGNLVMAEAGARMSRVASACVQAGLSGLEFLATVPGDIGGGVAMNAGAFGQQISDCLREVCCLLRDGSEIWLSADKLSMGYRHCRLPDGGIVLEAQFELQPDSSEAVRDRIRNMRARRSETQPLDQPNCGSVFTNPEGRHAAQLIEAAGLKGKTFGKARISEKHANFIVTEPGATASDVLALIRLARRSVREQFGIDLIPEVRIVGGQA